MMFSKELRRFRLVIFHFRVPYDSMYVMKECFLPINVALGLKRQSPIKDAVNLKLKQLREAGVVRANEAFFGISIEVFIYGCVINRYPRW